MSQQHELRERAGRLRRPSVSQRPFDGRDVARSDHAARRFSTDVSDHPSTSHCAALSRGSSAIKFTAPSHPSATEQQGVASAVPRRGSNTSPMTLTTPFSVVCGMWCSAVRPSPVGHGPIPAKAQRPARKEMSVSSDEAETPNVLCFFVAIRVYALPSRSTPFAMHLA